jgi:hypothetical protein
VYKGFRWRELRERDHLEEQGVDGIILKWIFTWCREAWTGCSGQVQGQVALVNAVTHLWVPQNAGNFLTS